MAEVDGPPPAAAEAEAASFAVKELVEVARRKFPGFNFEGGAAHVKKVNDEKAVDAEAAGLKDGSAQGRRTTNFTYDVKYVLGGSEKRVDAQWIVSKRLVARDELAAERAEELAARRKQQLEDEQRKAEEERVQRRKSLLLQLAKRREKARLAQGPSAPKKKRAKVKAAHPPKTGPARRPNDENTRVFFPPNDNSAALEEEEEEEVEEYSADCADDMRGPADLSASATWLQDFFAMSHGTLAPPDSPEEIPLAALVAAIANHHGKSPVDASEAALLPLLTELDEHNYATDRRVTSSQENVSMAT